MAWNEPGSDNRDPWGQGNGQNGPPDLDDLIKDLQKKFSGIFGGGGRKSAGGGSRGGMPSLGGKSSILIVVSSDYCGSRRVFTWSNRANKV